MATFEEFVNLAQISIKDKTSSKRLGEILHILREYHVSAGLTPEKAVKILEALGPTFVKLGQIASTRSDILPAAYCHAFEQLHANVAPVDFPTILATINASLDPNWEKVGHGEGDEAAEGGEGDGAHAQKQPQPQPQQQPWQRVFASIDPTPLGSASVAQVQKAQLLDGTVVAVKVRRPGVAESMAEDITLMKHILAWGEFVSAKDDTMILSMENFVDEMARTAQAEVDFTVELQHLRRFREVVAGEYGVTSPRAYPEYSSESVLVMEFVEGTELDKLATAQVPASKEMLHQIGERLVQSYVSQALDYGFFHADPHGGNIIIRATTSENPASFDVVWIDLGMVGTLSAIDRMLVSKIFHAVTAGNAYELKEAFLALSTARGSVDQGKLLASMSAILQQYGTANLADIVLGDLFEQVIEVLRSQNLIVKESITMLARGVVTLEGVLTKIAPDINVLNVVSRHVIKNELSTDNIKAKAIAMASTSLESAQSVAKLPRQASDTLDMLAKGELTIVNEMRVSNEALTSVYAAAGRVALALIAVGLFLGSSIICTTNMSPTVCGVPLLGFVGFVAATVLSMYLIIKILQKKRPL